jgi:dienelactone hydrolase
VKVGFRLRLSGALMLLPLLMGAAAGGPGVPSASQATTGTTGIAAVRYGVGTMTLNLVDTSRNRSLPTTINYPAAPGTSGTGAPPAAGPFPLVVAGHGSQGNGAGAANLHRYLTEAGYVVAAPTFPAGMDFPSMARDVSYVVTAMLNQSAGSSGTLAGLVNGDRIGYIGTSMGGMTGLTLSQTCCHDPRIDAVVSKIGKAPSGTYDWPGGAPLLMINGDADTTIRYQDALDTYHRAAAPKGLITLAGVGHDLNVGSSRILSDAPLAFFAYHLLGESDGLARVQAAVDASSIASLQYEWTAHPVKTAQTITFGALANKTLGAPPFTVSATASSGLAVTFTTSTSSVCSSSGTGGTTITLLAAGTCTVTAAQAGNGAYDPAPPVARSFVVQPSMSNQTITFGALADRTLKSHQFQVSATASSGLTVTFTSATPYVCSTGGTSGRTITLRKVGTCTIRASQAGNTSYNPAPVVSRSFSVTREGPRASSGGELVAAVDSSPAGGGGNSKCRGESS